MMIDAESNREMIRFENHDDYIEIAIASTDSGTAQPTGDVYVTIVVRSAGFVGHNDLWVVEAAMRSFCAGLLRLEQERLGHTTLESVLPEEMRVTIRSVDSRGHMAVEGATGYYMQRENSRPWHAVHFGFEFDPSQLTAAVSVDWVRQHGNASQ